MAWSNELLAKFALPQGTWQCEACLVNNPPNQKDICISCETRRDGGSDPVAKRKTPDVVDNTTKPKKKATTTATATNGHTFTFGIPSIVETIDITKTDRCGTVRSFGAIDCGQLGQSITDDDIMEIAVPTIIQDLKKKVMKRVSCGAMHTLVLEKGGKTIYSFGCNDDGVLGREDGVEDRPKAIDSFCDSKIIDIATGDCHSIALTEKGECFTWGTYRDASGYVGYSADELKQPLPCQVDFKKCKASSIVKVACGDNHTLAVDTNGSVWSWGSGEQGQLSRRVNPRRKTAQLNPGKVLIGSMRSKIKALNVFCGGFHSFITTTCGKVYAFGLNNYGQLGLGDRVDRMTPTLVDSLTNIETLDGGIHHSIALDKNGHVYTFGRADSSQCGLPNLGQERFVDTPTQLYGLPFIIQVACGGNHSFALSKGGSVYAWGFGESQQLGTGEDEDQVTPKKLDLPYSVYHIDGGAQFSALIGK